MLFPLFLAFLAQERVVAHDDLVIDRSCTLVFPAEPLVDEGEEGVVRIVGEGVTVLCEGALRGAPAGTPGDALEGVGILVMAKDVTLRGARVAGYRIGVRGRRCDGLALEDADVSGNFRQRLRSTSESEDTADWLWPHENDGAEWERYGAGIWLEDARGVTVQGCRAREGQNGLVLSRVEGARVFDNDFSFLSGWGIALWRSSGNVIARNALDFCIRGYSHGIYNRGQDSAGLLLFEQCSRNVIAENSATHCGDGIFAFGGREALGEGEVPESFDHTRKGNDDNVIVGNDLSFAAAHGLELTFSFGNVVRGNRLEGNAICGLWGGYSRDTLIEDNDFVANGDAGYGLERGGVNVEHGQRNVVHANRFARNACGVHLWWDPDEGLAALPWTRANGHASADNRIVANRFEEDEVAIQLRAAGPTVVRDNVFESCGKEVEADEGSPRSARASGDEPRGTEEPAPLPGTSRPVGARRALGGREAIVVGEWGPVEPEAARLPGADEPEVHETPF